jgi:hypothetical protein
MQISEDTLYKLFIAYGEEILARVKYAQDLEKIADEFIEEVKSIQMKG